MKFECVIACSVIVTVCAALVAQNRRESPPAESIVDDELNYIL